MRGYPAAASAASICVFPLFAALIGWSSFSIVSYEWWAARVCLPAVYSRVLAFSSSPSSSEPPLLLPLSSATSGGTECDGFALGDAFRSGVQGCRSCWRVAPTAELDAVAGCPELDGFGSASVAGEGGSMRCRASGDGVGLRAAGDGVGLRARPDRPTGRGAALFTCVGTGLWVLEALASASLVLAAAA